jgi:hypothetical protein
MLVTLSCGTAGATIRFTTDGSEPDGNSPTGTTVLVTQSTMLKAKAFKQGRAPSAAAEGPFHIIAPSRAGVVIMVLSDSPDGSKEDYPYEEFFEGYEAETALVSPFGVGIDGWHAPPSNEGVLAVRNRYSYEGRPALPGVFHDKVLYFDLGSLCVRKALVEHSTAVPPWGTWGRDTNVWIDAIVPTWPLAAPPALPDDVQAAAYFNMNGRLEVYHAYYDDHFLPVRQWTELSHPPVGTDEVVRVTIMTDYLSDAPWTHGGPLYGVPFENKFFTVELNGGGPLLSAWAYPLIPVEDNASELGQWVDGQPPKYFITANGAAEGGGNSWLGSVGVGGSAWLDDLVVTTGMDE